LYSGVRLPFSPKRLSNCASPTAARSASVWIALIVVRHSAMVRPASHALMPSLALTPGFKRHVMKPRRSQYFPLA
jgi:hypothetical protein